MSSNIICERCGHEWKPYKIPPRICAKCKSKYWQTRRTEICSKPSNKYFENNRKAAILFCTLVASERQKITQQQLGQDLRLTQSAISQQLRKLRATGLTIDGNKPNWKFIIKKFRDWLYTQEQTPLRKRGVAFGTRQLKQYFDKRIFEKRQMKIDKLLGKNKLSIKKIDWDKIEPFLTRHLRQFFLDQQIEAINKGKAKPFNELFDEYAKTFSMRFHLEYYASQIMLPSSSEHPIAFELYKLSAVLERIFFYSPYDSRDYIIMKELGTDES